MAEPLVATLNVAFNEDDEGVGDNAGQNKITLQQMTKRFDLKGRLLARCFPASGVKFTTSTGTIEVGAVRSQQVYEGLRFSNSSSASLKFAGATGVVINSATSVLMQKTKNTYGKTVITPVTGVTLRYDVDKGAVVAETRGYDPNNATAYTLREVPVYGACSVRYSALYQILYYTPTVQRVGFSGGTAWGIGTIFGYNDYDVATLEMELELDTSSSPDWFEYGRVTSKIVLDAKGVWEFPPSWESTYSSNKDKVGDQREDYAPGVFPGYSHEIDPDNSFVDTRVHLIVKINSIGTLMYDDQNNGGDGYWSWYAPYFGSGSWNPKYDFTFTAPPGGAKAGSAEDFKHDLNNRTWRDVFVEVDVNELKDRLDSDYPGITFGKRS